MNIIPFSTDVNYTPPDIDLIKLSIEPMLKLAADAEFAFNETRYLPSMYAKAQGLYTLVVHAQGKIDEHIYTLETVTGNALTSLHRYRAEQIDDTPEEKHSLNAYARAQTITTFKKTPRKRRWKFERNSRTCSVLYSTQRFPRVTWMDWRLSKHP